MAQETRVADERLRLSEERFRLMVQSIRDYAIFMLDPKGRVASWNEGAQRIKQYRAEEIIGQHISRFYPEPDVLAGKVDRELEEAERVGRFEDEGWRVRKDGSRFWANVIITALRDPSGNLIGFAKVTRDLTERTRLEEEKVVLAQAREAVRLRDEFLSIASHELKTPLTAMQLHLQSLRDKIQVLDAKLAAKLERAIRSGTRLADLIETLLDVSRIATGRFELNPEKFDLSATVVEVLERLRGAAVQAGCELATRIEPGLVGGWDRLRLEQVVTNLLANSFKYGAGSRVEVSLRRDGAQAELIVTDAGPGIAEKDLPRIFERFERAVSMRNYGGMGLGLYVTRQIVNAHGGTVDAGNRPEGGAVFTVRLPLAAAVRARHDAHPPAEELR
jgi:PAS domain S-box-containing protein